MIDVSRSLEMMAATQGPCETAGRIAAKMFDTTLLHIRGPQRRHHIVRARHFAMWAATQTGRVGYSEIGRYFGARDHSTVIYGVRRAESLMGYDQVFRALGQQILSRMGIEAA